MAFQKPYDYFNLTSSQNGLVVQESSQNVQASTAEGHNEKGDVVAFEVFGERMSPSATYLLGKDYSLPSLQMGVPIQGTGDYAQKKFVYAGVTITTAAGQPPTIQVTGEEIPTTIDHTDCYYQIPSATLELCHHAQALWGVPIGPEDLGTGNYLQNATYTAGGNLSLATKDGEIVSYDITDGKLEVQATIIQTGQTAPTITIPSGSDWSITSPLTCSNPDADYPSWTVTLSKYLIHATTNVNP